MRVVLIAELPNQGNNSVRCLQPNFWFRVEFEVQIREVSQRQDGKKLHIQKWGLHSPCFEPYKWRETLLKPVQGCSDNMEVSPRYVIISLVGD